MKDPTERNRENAVAFYNLIFNKCQPRRAVTEYVGETYVQHNPEVGHTKGDFIRYCEWLNRQYPGKTAEFLTVLAERDLVVIYTRQFWPGESEYSAVDFFRFDAHGKIIEHWDVVQPASADEFVL